MIFLFGVIKLSGEKMKNFNNHIPVKFTKLVSYIESNNLSDFFNLELGFNINLLNTSRGYGMPPEFYPIADMDVDGVKWGFLLLAPELELGDIPLIQFSPMDNDKYIIEGKNTEDSIINILTSKYEIYLELEEDELKIKQVELILTQLYKDLFGIKFTKDYIHKINSINKEYNLKDVLKIPTDYTFIKTSDGLGILVPKKYVNEDINSIKVNTKDFKKIKNEVIKYIDNQLYGNALYIIREFYINTSFNDEFKKQNQELAKYLIKIYRNLDRSILINNVDKDY